MSKLALVRRSFDQEQGYRDIVESLRVAGSFDVSEALSVQVNDNLSVDVFVENLIDEYYFLNSLSFSDGEFIVSGVRRIFEIGARYNF
jgi:outer membrane receptor for ferric coprogen and ferric-rhodotorulic acid